MLLDSRFGLLLQGSLGPRPALPAAARFLAATLTGADAGGHP